MTTTITTGGNAFPFTGGADLHGNILEAEKGMSLRDYFAAKAMVGLLAEEVMPEGTSYFKRFYRKFGNKAYPEHFTYIIADAMLEKRAKK